MPCYLFTFHAYGSWMPDRKEGFVRRDKEGIQPPDEDQARQYRERAKHDEASFSPELQLLLIEETRIACEKQRYRAHAVATEPTHVHALVSWPDERPWLKVRNGLKSSLTRRLNREVARREWFVNNSSRKRVKDDDHFAHLIHEYLPSHSGWKWSEGGEPYR